MEKIDLSAEQIQFLRDSYAQKMPIKEIQKTLGISNTTFYRMKKKYNIVSDRNVYSLKRGDNDEQLFYEKFCNNFEIYKPLENDYKYKGYKLNEEFFDIIDSQEKAYILGLFLADGNMNQSQRYFQISLQEGDGYILERIKHILCYEGELKFHNLHDKNPNHQNQFHLAIASRHFCRALIFYGLVPNKSLVQQFPMGIPIKYYRHLIRGFFDGNGTLSNNPKEKRVRFISTKYFCEDAKLLIEHELNINCSIRSMNYNDVTSEIRIAGNHQASIFLNWIYQDATIFLSRKYKRYCDHYINNSLLE